MARIALNWPLRLSLHLLALGSLVSACQLATGPCIEDHNTGEKFRVHLLEPYDKSSQFRFDKTYAGEDFHPSCGGIDGLVAPVVLDFEILPETETSGSCSFKMADLIDGSAVTPPVQGQGSRDFIELNGSRSRIVFSSSLTQPLETGCRAQWLGNLLAPNGKEGLYADPVPGALPPGVFGRRRTCAGSSGICVDYFAAKVERLP
jgi:hypothetical protein